MRMDAHQHFWTFDPARDVWIDASMERIRRDFQPLDLKPELDQNQVDGCIAIQAAESDEETRFLLDLACEHRWIRKVVGWADLRSQRLEQDLERWAGHEKLAGFRQVIQNLDPGLMFETGFRTGLSLLGTHQFTFDLLIYPHHLDAATALVRDFPEQMFVIDHLAKPTIKSGILEPWTRKMNQIARHENVFCKLSGMVTEADWHSWTFDDLAPYMETVLNGFGPSRLMFGSDWPVALLASSYSEVIDVCLQFIEPLSTSEQQQIMGETACHFYGIES